MADLFSTSGNQIHYNNDNVNRKTRLYDPYDGLQRNYTKSNPHKTLYNLPTSPDILFYEDAIKRHRSWSENLTFYTGASYLLGTVTGGVAGTFSGIRAAERGESFKVRFSRVLNSGGHSGRKFGNSLGVMGLMFAGIESTIFNYRGEVDDSLNYVFAGVGTGVLYRSAAGPRSAAVAGAVGGLIAGAAVFGKNVVKRYIPI